ncbi:hydroxyisobutyryl-CoA hydrolase, mitochondrial [Seminavis robusta]|uniref:3-hydroxyisobutyryl-CoA hydrolase n=1 Tax=Seminavis robusta TaxID=568900 RepID=A0A9N8DF10_9STRA|nr:hydroxyisobutyryl-CoA hydrolase, mitochondrial [Seminavis robusta]|eukprot:Sro93_g048380.1 hydroxyisobutyryl-CoA hydrolase, mitochondrial (408) ;mRNA; f:33271-34494
MRFTTKLLPSLSGNLGVLQLNNPKALNALAMDMIDCFSDTLDQWYHPNSQVRAILLKPADNEEAKRPIFCAGGNVKAMYESRMEQEGTHGQGVEGLATADFFRKEYNINYRLATSKNIPQISLWNGIVMGGGAGISVHGKYRVATEHSLFAMPETALGLFPDVGSLYWMPRLFKGGLPAYVALTGHRLKPEDLMYTGLATHYVPSEYLEELEKALVDASVVAKTAQETFDPFAAILMKFHEMTPVDPSDSFLAKQRKVIDDVFTIAPKTTTTSVGDDNVKMEDIMAKLETLKSTPNEQFACETLETLKKASPTSLKITLEGLKRGAAASSLGEDLQMEFRLSQACTRRKDTDFMEGVRALLVDKDKNPKWNPSTLEEVTEEMVESYFGPVEQEWKIPAPTDATAAKL